MNELNNIPKNNPFRVPGGYLENLPGNLAEIARTVPSQPEKEGIVRKMRPYLSAAAAVALVAILGYTGFYFVNRKVTDNLTPEITLTDQNNELIDDIDIITIEEQFVASGPSTGIADINRNEIIEYLISENIDINEILVQL